MTVVPASAAGGSTSVVTLLASAATDELERAWKLNGSTGIGVISVETMLVGDANRAYDLVYTLLGFMGVSRDNNGGASAGWGAGRTER